MPPKIPGRTRPNRVLGPSYPRHCEEAGITTPFVFCVRSGDNPITLFDLVSEQMISKSESVEILRKSVKDQMKACLGYGKKFSEEIVQQFSVKNPGELDLDDVCQMLYN